MLTLLVTRHSLEKKVRTLREVKKHKERNDLQRKKIDYVCVYE